MKFEIVIQINQLFTKEYDFPTLASESRPAPPWSQVWTNKGTNLQKDYYEYVQTKKQTNGWTDY